MSSKVKTAEKFHTFVIVGLGMWGQGKTEADAKDAFRGHFGNLNRPHVLYSFPEGVEFSGVDDSGAVHYTWTDPENPITPVKIERRFPKEK